MEQQTQFVQFVAVAKEHMEQARLGNVRCPCLTHFEFWATISKRSKELANETCPSTELLDPLRFSQSTRERVLRYLSNSMYTEIAHMELAAGVSPMMVQRSCEAQLGTSNTEKMEYDANILYKHNTLLNIHTPE